MIKLIIKSKYIRKYRGPSGKMVYIYKLPEGREPKKEEEKPYAAKLKLFEDSIRNLKYESCSAFVGDKSVFTKVGSSDSIQFTRDDAKLFKNADVFTHNHPEGYSFSIEDMLCTIDLKIKEMRAVVTNGVCIARFDDSYDPEKRSKFYQVYKEAYDKIFDDLSFKILTQEITSTMAGSMHQDKVWNEVKNKMEGFYYEKKEIKD